MRYGVIGSLTLFLIGCAAGTTGRLIGGEGDVEGYEPGPPPARADSGSVDTSGIRTDRTDTGVVGANIVDSTAPTPVAREALELRRVGQYTTSGIQESRRLVIRNEAEWERFWSELGTDPRPAVDFSRETVIAATAGTRPTGGYSIQIDQAVRDGARLMIEVTEIAPGPSCITTQVVTQPVDVVIVPLTEFASWSFIERGDVRDCM